VAVGPKIGMLVDIHTKGKNWDNRYATTVVGYSENYVQKLKDKYFFNNTRITGVMRVGYGNFTAFGTYQLGAFVKEGMGPIMKPWSVGLCVSGL
jgi:hypothetical protein